MRTKPSSRLPAVDFSVPFGTLAQFSEDISSLAEELRSLIVAPNPRKDPPTFNSTQVMEMCGLDRQRFNYLLHQTELPKGQLQSNKRTRIFTLEELRKWIIEASSIPKSPIARGLPGRGKIVVVNQLKGGSAKTTTAMCLGQGLNLMGRKVLVIDLDPQSSITELCGMYAERDVGEEDTVMPFIYEPDTFDIKTLVKTTYWDGLDVIPAHQTLFAAEFHLPAMVNKDPRFKFWDVFRAGFDSFREDYDYIILDTAPSLSYVTINALFAADAMVMPLVPESLDFISSVSFWSLFSNMYETVVKHDPALAERQYDFVSVLLSKVDYSPASSAPVVRDWARRAYGEWLHPIEIPVSRQMSASGLGLSTVFDFSSDDARRASTTRIREPLANYCQWIDDKYKKEWSDS